ncbi:toll-like receptor 4 [Centruroides vittatus]|uniref:toll-like receptor 4 n=1 Tax=Centruroides vittatus TaxID=120091 RepID=UPI00350F7549
MDLILNTAQLLILIAFISRAKTLDVIRHFNTYGHCDVLSVHEYLYISGKKCDSLYNLPASSNTTHLFINGTSISSFATNHLNKYPNLLHLEVTHSKLQALEFHSFCNLTELRMIKFSYNRISELRSETFCSLKNLTSLVLAHNDITNVKNITHLLSEYTPSLTNLDLSENNLITIQSDDFQFTNDNNIEVLSLSSCNLNHIDPTSFTNLQKLKYLILSKNNLTIENLSEIFRNLAGHSFEYVDIASAPSSLDALPALRDLNLKKLKFGFTNIPLIKRSEFSDLNNLEELTIVNANVMNITDDAFENLPNLTSLTIVPNILNSLPKGILLSKLHYLNISGRPWSPKKFTIFDFSFASMSNLHTLDLSFNFLIRLSEASFTGLSNLRHLRIRRCGIHYIQDVTFEPFSNLLSLDISFNSILIKKLLIKKIFPHLKVLKSLTFQQVPLTLSASDKLFSELIHLEHIDLSNSSLNLVSQNIFANLNKIKHIYLSHNLIREWREPIFSPFSNLVSLDLSHNYIVKVTSSMMEDFEKIPKVDLSGNSFNCSCDILPFLEWVNSSEIIISDYFKHDYNEYKCDSPKELFNSELFKVHNFLDKDCNANPAFAALIVLAVILILILVAVVSGYLYKFHFGRRLLSISDKNFTYDAFISYNANDSDWVFSTLLPRLETNTSDLKLCVYDRDFVAGRGISECIMESIKCSRRTILILSNNFLQSPWCKFETDLAHHVLIDEEREGLLLIKLEELSNHLVTTQLNYLLKTKIYLEWSNDPKEQDLFWKKLRQALKPKEKIVSKII